MDIVSRISKVLAERNVNGVQLGSYLGLQKSPMTDWKNGKSKPTLEQLIMICEKFAISADYLLFGKEENTCDNMDGTDDSENELLQNYRKLDSRRKHKLHLFVYNEIESMVCKDADAPKRIPFAASGEIDISTERDALIQKMLQEFEAGEKEIKGG